MPAAPWYLRLIPIVASLALFFLSCALPAVYLDTDSPPSWPGIMALILGLFALFDGQLGWLANPVYGIALLLPLFRQWVATVVVALVAFAFALLSLTLVGTIAPLDEGGVRKALVTGLGPGFYVWLASMLTLAGGAVALKFYERAHSSAGSRPVA